MGVVRLPVRRPMICGTGSLVGPEASRGLCRWCDDRG